MCECAVGHVWWGKSELLYAGEIGMRWGHNSAWVLASEWKSVLRICPRVAGRVLKPCQSELV